MFRKYLVLIGFEEESYAGQQPHYDFRSIKNQQQDEKWYHGTGDGFLQSGSTYDRDVTNKCPNLSFACLFHSTTNDGVPAETGPSL